MENLEKLRTSSKKKLIVMILSTALPLIIVLVMSIGNFEISANSIFAVLPFLPPILCVIFEGYIAYKIIDYVRIIKSNDYANSKLVIKKDERTNFIEMKSDALIQRLFIYIMGVGTIFSAFVDYQVFYTFFATLMVFIIIHVIVKIYYNKKY